MGKASEQTIDAVGNLYMTGMSDQISAHFETIIESKFNQAESAIEVVSPDNDNIDDLYSELKYRVWARDFKYLALCSEEGELQMLYGEQIQLVDPEPFFESLRNKQRKIAVGTDLEGNDIVLLGVDARYPMSDGRRCIAMVVAIPVEYITTMLAMDKEDSLVHSHIIRKDGSFVIHEGEDYPDYFSTIRENMMLTKCRRRMSLL